MKLDSLTSARFPDTKKADIARSRNVFDLTDIGSQSPQYETLAHEMMEKYRMLLSTPIVQIMNRDPISIEISHSILEAIQILSEGRFHHLPVVDQKRLVGILSTVDILKFNGEAFHGSEDSKPALVASRMCVGDVMVKDVIPLSERATIGDAVALLSNGDFHSVPVMTATGLLIGIVTTTDIIRHLLETPVTPELPENVRARMQTIEKVYAAAQSFLASDRTALALDHLERAVQEARWAA